MQQKQIIKDCYSQLLTRNCKMVQTFTLHNQLNDLALRIKSLNLNDPDIYVDHCIDEEDRQMLGLDQGEVREVSEQNDGAVIKDAEEVVMQEPPQIEEPLSPFKLKPASTAFGKQSSAIASF